MTKKQYTKYFTVPTNQLIDIYWVLGEKIDWDYGKNTTAKGSALEKEIVISLRQMEQKINREE